MGSIRGKELSSNPCKNFPAGFHVLK